MIVLRRIALLVAAALFLFALFGFAPIDGFGVVRELALGALILAVVALL